MDIVALITGIVIGGIFAFVLAWILLKKSKGVPAVDMEKIAVEKDRIEKENLLLNERLKEIPGLKEDIRVKQAEIIHLSENNAAREAELKNMNQKLAEQKDEIEKVQVKLQTEFKNLANEILDEKTKKFTEQNKNNLSEILKPLGEKIKEFEKKVEDTYEKGLRDRTELQAELKKLQDMNTKISQEANNLTKALKGDVKKQGNWGEVILERILESSGLKKGEEYITQFNAANDEGKRIQPDVVVMLPDKKHIIIDSKVSLVAYEQYVNAESENDRQQYAKEHIRSVRAHIRELSDKKYQTSGDFNTPEYVLLFIPIESSFSVALQEDQELFGYAWDNKIVIVSPSTLIATLMTIASVWKQENQTRNAIEIARQSGALYDKFEGFVKDLERIGKSIKSAEDTYETAMGKLKTGKGSLVSRAEKIKVLGAKATKSLPDGVLDDMEEDEGQ